MLQILARALCVGFAGVLMQAGNCITVVNPPSDSGGDGVPSDKVAIRFVNQSADALDPQFYASSAALGDPNAMLFTSDRVIATGFGFAGRGTLGAGESDEIVLDCAAAQAIGTKGGEFLDVNTGAVKGTGQQKYAGIQQVYNCGSTVTFYYRTTSSGYTTTLLAE